LQKTFSFDKATVGISYLASHLTVTKIEGMSDVYVTHYSVSLDGPLIVTKG
jgi:hypothetical protein